jgi:medium-chain acyl-[acyl-carrier-protein] hydrolase
LNSSIPRIWEETFTVCSWDTDETHHAGIPALWRYLQEAAGTHAGLLGMGVEDLLRINRTWVLSRMRLHLFRRPAWHEKVTVATWPAGLRSLFASRGFALHDDQNKPVAQATSDWIFLDLAAHKPARPPEWLASAAPDPIPPLALPESGRLVDLPNAEWTIPFPVRRGDIDLNRHATNSAYVDWALETPPDAFCRGKCPVDLDMVYRASAVRGDVIRSEAAPEGEHAILHRLVRDSDGAVLAQGRSLWAPVTASR